MRENENNIIIYMIYYLVYKINRSPLLWVVKEDNNLDNILDDHYNLPISNIDKYYVYENSDVDENIILKNFKRFKLFNPTSDDILIYYS